MQFTIQAATIVTLMASLAVTLPAPDAKLTAREDFQFQTCSAEGICFDTPANFGDCKTFVPAFGFSITPESKAKSCRVYKQPNCSKVFISSKGVAEIEGGKTTLVADIKDQLESGTIGSVMCFD